MLRSLLALLPLLAAVAPAQEEVPLGVLREGHWVVLSGELSGLDAFLVEEVELTQMTRSPWWVSSRTYAR